MTSSRDPVPSSTIIWKYFEHRYFESLIKDGSLFFRRVIDFADKDDAYEGTIPEMDKVNDRKIALMRSGSIEQLSREVGIAESIDGWGMRHRVVINSWKIAETEVNHMWKLYSKIDKGGVGVAVRSTIASLTKALESQPRLIYASKIRYIDYNADRFYKAGVYEHGTGNVMVPIFHKNIHGYTDENEFRLVHQFTEGGRPEEWWDDCGDCRGCRIEVDLPELICEVVLSPNATEGDREYSEKCVKLSLTTTQNDEHDQDQNNQRERSQWL